MDLQIVNPLDHPDWDGLLLRSGDDSFFHTSNWAKVIVASYGCKPVYFAGFAGDRLSLLMPFMEISSPLTGKRGVSLPFTDFCDPFMPDKRALPGVVQAVMDLGKQRKWDYVEWRSAGDLVDGAGAAESYLTHDLDLGCTESELFSGLRESNRRSIRKATKEGVTLRFEDSPEALKDFYRLHCRTRKRHGLPPQPFSFFRNIREHILAEGLGILVSAFYSGNVIASSVFFHFGPTAIFKYGASDPRFLSHRPNNLVLWEAIKWYKARGLKALSLGRTEPDNPGLLRFKRAWGAAESGLRYYRYNFQRDVFSQSPLYGNQPRALLSKVPLCVLRLMGRVLYRHIG